MLLVGCANLVTTKHNPQAKLGAVVLTPTGEMATRNKAFADAYEARAYQLMTDAVIANLPAKYKQKYYR